MVKMLCMKVPYRVVFWTVRRMFVDRDVVALKVGICIPNCAVFFWLNE